MLVIRVSTEHGLTPVSELVPNSWIDVTTPTAAEIEWLQDVLKAPATCIVAALDMDERARIDRIDGAVLIIVRTPHDLGGKADTPYKTIPLGIILVNHYIITISQLRTRVVDGLANATPTLLTPTQPSRLVLALLLAIAQNYVEEQRTISRQIDAIEEKLQKSLSNSSLLDLLKYQKSLVYFTTGLKANELMLERMQKNQLLALDAVDHTVINDVLIEHLQAREMTMIDSSILSQMMEVFASIIANNQNVVMKFLAAVTVILSLPTLLTGIYGMNTVLPWNNSALTFYAVVGGAVFLSLLVTWVFRNLNWL